MIKCKHYVGDGYTYRIPEEISLCNKCEERLRKAIFDQAILERQLSKM